MRPKVKPKMVRRQLVAPDGKEHKVKVPVYPMGYSATELKVQLVRRKRNQPRAKPTDFNYGLGALVDKPRKS